MRSVPEPAIVAEEARPSPTTADSGMLERCVAAIGDRVVWDDGLGNTLIDWRGVVRDIVEALREPTDAMVEAAWTDTVRASPDERMALELGNAKDAFRHKLKRRHRAMIDAVLDGGGSTSATKASSGMKQDLSSSRDPSHTSAVKLEQ